MKKYFKKCKYFYGECIIVSIWPIIQYLKIIGSYQIFELLEYGKQIWDGKRNGHKPTGSLRRREIGPGTFE